MTTCPCALASIIYNGLPVRPKTRLPFATSPSVLRPPIETTFSAWTTMLPRRRPGPVDKVICASGLSERSGRSRSPPRECRCPLSHCSLRRQAHSAQQVAKTRVRAHWVKHGLHSHPNQPPLAMGIRLFEEGKGLVTLPQPGMDDGNLGPGSMRSL